MAQPRGLTYDDIHGSPVVVNPGGSLARAQTSRALNAEDLFPTVPKVEEPFEEGSSLKVGSLDTGIPLSTSQAQFLAGAGKRITDVGQRAKQLVGAPGAQREIDEAVTRDAPLMATTPGALGYFAPDVAASMLVPATRVLPSAVVGAAQGFVTPTTSADNNGTAVNTALGAVGGAAGQVVGKAIGNTVGKAVNTLPAAIPDRLRQMAAGRGINLPQPKWQDAEQQRLYELARSRGVPTTIGDIDPTSNWYGVENVSRSFASGRTPFMQQQQDATRNVIDDLRGRFGTGSGDEGARIAQGVKDQYTTNRQAASQKFKDVETIAATTPNTPIKPDQTYQAAQDIITDYPAILEEFRNKPVLKKFFGIERDMGPQTGLIINPKNMQPFQYPQELTFKEAQETRKALGSLYDELRTAFEKNPKTVVGGGDTVRKAAQLFSAFNKDLDAWGKQPGNKLLNTAWSDARSFFKDNVMPYRDPSMLESKSPLIRQMANENVDTATIADRVLPSRETSIARDVMDLSTAKGQAAMKSALIGRMTDDAVSPDIQGLGNASLLRHTTKHGHSGEAVFTPGERQAIADTRDIAKLTRRSAEAGTATPPTGARALPFLAGAGTLAVAPAAYMGLGMFGDQLDPATRIGLAFGAVPLGALAALRGANRYATSGFGKQMHFGEPQIGAKVGYGQNTFRNPLGTLQDASVRGARGAVEPAIDEFNHHQLGHRP